jgi:hypothetical protein
LSLPVKIVVPTAMSSPLPSRRPWDSSYSSPSGSLSGMEIPISKQSLYFGPSSWSIYPVPHGTIENPLPPTPRKPSSVYSLGHDEEAGGQMRNIPDALLPPDLLLQPTTYRSSTSIVPVMSADRPPLLRYQLGHAVSDSILERRRVQREDLAELGIHSSQLLTQHPISDTPTHREPQTKGLHELDLQRRDADHHASTYESVLHTRSSVLTSFTSEPYSNYTHSSTEMSPRITDVVDQSLLPPPLRYSTVVADSRPSSHLSSSSSTTEIIESRVRDSLRTYARKALHLQTPTVAARSKREDQNNSATNAADWASSILRRGSSVAGQRRGSVQQGISHMYNSLRKISITSALPKTVGNATKVRLPRELRSPAIPITPYQQMGTKAWERSSKSPKNSRPGSAISNHFHSPPKEDKKSFRHDHRGRNQETKPISLVNKLITAFHSGTVQVESAIGLNKPRNKHSKAEFRREEFKKKIVVIGIGDQPVRVEGNENWL